jgi:tail lysozyme
MIHVIHSWLAKRIRHVAITAECIFSIAIIVCSPVVASAVTTAQQRAFNIGAGYFNTEVGCGIEAIGTTPGGGGSRTSGNADVYKNPHVRQAFIFLEKAGFSAPQAAGIVGNLMIESHPTIDPNAKGDYRNGVPTSFGIAQWHDGRGTAMKQWVSNWSAQHNDPDGWLSFYGELNYLLNDLNTGYTSVRDHMLKATTAIQAADIWDREFERSTSASLPDRENYAIGVMKAATDNGWSTSTGTDVQAPTVILGKSGSGGGGSGGTTTGTADCAATAPTSADCGSATGPAKIFCAAQKYKGIWYTFGGGHGGGYAGFRKKCPLDLTFIANAVAKSTISNPGPCTTDCSSLVSVATDEAMGKSYMWVVSDITTHATPWQKVSITSAQRGDIVTRGLGHAGEHVEIVDHIDNTSKRIYTFGSHHTGSTTGPTSAPISYYDEAWHWPGT